MRIQIRQSVFETNSSSMHSIVIKKQIEYFTTEEVRKSFHYSSDDYAESKWDWDIKYEGKYFGRTPFQILSTFEEKALYVLASICQYKYDSIFMEVFDTIKDFIPNLSDITAALCTEKYSLYNNTEEYIIERFGKGNYYLVGDMWVCWYYDLGSVDEDILSNFLKTENISISEFLKNKKYVVVVDGDEYCIYKDMKRAGLIDKNAIEKEYYPSNWMEDDEE